MLEELRTGGEPIINLLDCKMEAGPSRRGSELFKADTAKKPEEGVELTENKLMNKNLDLQLSLRLPIPGFPSAARSVESSCGSFDTDSDGSTENKLMNKNPDLQLSLRLPIPGFPSAARSVESSCGSFDTDSDGSSAAKPSQLSHGSGCSACYSSSGRDRSVESRPMFLEVDSQVVFSDEPNNKDVSVVQGLSTEGNGLHPQSLDYLENSSNQAATKQFKTMEGSFMTAVELQPQLWSIRADFDDSIIRMIVSEPLKVVARRLSQMSVQETVLLKESVRLIILNPDKQSQLISFQKAIQSRSDITLETLVKSFRTQLEILLAVKTGLQDFLQCNNIVPSSDLVEIFLNIRCRNLTCRCLLPVDECNCRFCVQKNGFCRDCMCLSCSKFDMEVGTCSWVGCDFCLHWCHADCGLRESYIRNGHIAGGPKGATEMQFHCVACGHPSEMFGFAKEAFVNSIEEWTAEALSRELNYLEKIFCDSEDFRGKQLYDLAIQMLSNLENSIDIREVKSHMILFFTGRDIFSSSFKILDRTVKVDMQVGGLLMEKGSIDGKKLKSSMEKGYLDRENFRRMQLIESEETMKAFNGDKDNMNLNVLTSETDTSLLLERAKMLLGGNKGSRMMQRLGLEDSMKAFDKYQDGNNWASFSSSSSSSVCNYRKRKLY